MANEFKWWASVDQERYTIGPCDTREQVIAEATENDLGLRRDENGHWGRLTFHIQEATQELVQISDVIDFEQAIENACVAIDEEHGDPESGEGICADAWSTEQEADLKAALKQAVADWQARHSIALKPWIFTETRSDECIDLRVPLPLT